MIVVGGRVIFRLELDVEFLIELERVIGGVRLGGEAELFVALLLPPLARLLLEAFALLLRPRRPEQIGQRLLLGQHQRCHLGYFRYHDGRFEVRIDWLER